jgi:hypothetical protein
LAELAEANRRSRVPKGRRLMARRGS